LSTELAVNELFSGLPVNALATQEALQELIPPSTFLPYIQLLQPMSKGAETYRAGEFTFTSNGKTQSLTSEFLCIPIQWRPKAIYTATGQAIEVYHDPENPRFKQLREIAQNTKSGMSDARFGTEVLLWLPDMNDFGAFFLASTTLRNCAASIIKHMSPPSPILIQSNKIQKNKNTWYGVLVEESLTPVTNLPARNVLESTVKNFVENKGTEVKQVETTSDRER